MTLTVITQPLYIMALRPTNPQDDAALVKAARPYAAQARGYILSNAPFGGIAHATLSFFRAESDAAASRSLDQWPTDAALDFAPTVTTLKHKPDPQDPANVWTHLDLARDEQLIGLQRQVRAHLERLGFEPMTKAETFDPHITLTRRKGNLTDPAVNPDKFTEGRVVPCHLDVLRATELGMALYSVSSTPLPRTAPKVRLPQLC